eukprot:TRINITY_DN2519_c0_g1_i1.p1 TRINITY_DN2519_c0_g1~~TRINITY_DN2519_c0_g1_i1.p1  ORF type:complete len:596 (-),score=191.35 TRINITY_DN2519_c0_g1_i1:152-1939(-)
MSVTPATVATLTTNAEFSKVVFDKEVELLVMGTITAPPAPETDEQRKPIDLVACVDVSGSMKDRLPLVKESLHFVVSQLTKVDRLAVVAYESTTKVEFALDYMTPDNKETVTKIIDKMVDLGGTNLWEGLDQGIKQISNRTVKQDIASVILFTDGQANEGLSKIHQILPAMNESLQKVGANCSVFSFGFGSDHDEKLLRGIADNASGMYYFLEKKDDIPNAFADTLGGLLSVVGQNVELKISALNSVRIKKVFTKYKVTTQPNGDLLINFLDIYGDEKRDVICQLILPALASPKDNFELLKFEASLFDVINTKNIELTTVAVVDRPSEVEEGLVPNFALDRERNRSDAADSMEEARKIADRGDLDSAKKLLESTINKVSNSVSKDDILCKEFVKDMREAIVDMENKQRYREIGSKKMAWKEQKFSKQRTAGDSETYTSNTKAKMKAAYMHSKSITPTPTTTTVPTTSTSTTTTATTSTGTRLNLQVGNTHTLIPESEAEESKVTPGQKLVHDWTLYVRGSDVSAIERVEFTIHPSYTPNKIIVYAAPFEVQRFGWGYFESEATIYFKSGTPYPPSIVVKHVLDFSGSGSFKEVVV